jgi:catechol 2,3-dioxygenase-like lactoylglutathione lyase family enzyme
MNLNQVTLPATDLDASAAFYRRMGFRQIVANPPEYARFECPEGEATFSLHRVSTSTPRSAAVVYFETVDLDAQVRRLQDAGFVFSQMPID